MQQQYGHRFRWVHAACREFSEATGWPLEFVETEGRGTERWSDSASHAEPGCRTLKHHAAQARGANGHTRESTHGNGESHATTAVSSLPNGDEQTSAEPWSADVADGVRTLGRLRLNGAPGNEDVPPPPEVTRLAELHRRLLCSQLSSSRKLHSLSRELGTLVDLQRNVPAEQDPLGAMERLLRATFSLTGFRSVAFMLLDPRQESVGLRMTHRVPAAHIPGRRRRLDSTVPDAITLREGRCLIRRTGDNSHANWLPDTFSMGLCLRVEAEAGPVGTLWAYDRRDREPTSREIHVLESIAAQVAHLLERVVLLHESAEQSRLRRDLQVASASQSLDVLRDLPEDPGFDAAGTCTSHYEVGGDLCELIPLGNHRTLIAVGDASGDSIPAALVMSNVRGALRAATESNHTSSLCPSEVVRMLNSVLYAITPSHQFMSLVCAVLDSRQRTLTYTNAGHPAPLLWRGDCAEELESHGLLLGVLANVTYAESTLSLSQDDTLVMFSDGISEAMNRRQLMFRSDGIAEALLTAVDGSAEQILRAVHERLQLHTHGNDDSDDRTLLVVRVR